MYSQSPSPKSKPSQNQRPRNYKFKVFRREAEFYAHKDHLLNLEFLLSGDGIVTKEEIRSIIPSLDSTIIVSGLSMILYEPNNFMHVRLNPSF